LKLVPVYSAKLSATSVNTSTLPSFTSGISFD